jgi:hypothetical protein
VASWGAVCADFIPEQGVFRPPQRPATRSGDDQHDHAVKNEHLQSDRLAQAAGVLRR